jgi:hypothetical protein
VGFEHARAECAAAAGAGALPLVFPAPSPATPLGPPPAGAAPFAELVSASAEFALPPLVLALPPNALSESVPRAAEPSAWF